MIIEKNEVFDSIKCNRQKIQKAHIELYKYVKDKYEQGDKFHKDDLLEIYNRFVRIRKPSDYNFRVLTEEQLYNNASAWLDRAISVLVRRGYLGLIFRIDVGPIEDALGEDKCLT